MSLKSSSLHLSCIILLLSGCLAPGEYFYTGQLSDHDEAIFAEAARIEGVEIVAERYLGVWIVEYESLPKYNGFTDMSSGMIFIDPDIQTLAACDRDRTVLVLFRHEIGHALGKSHSPNPLSVMHDPAPCWPTN